MNPHRCACPRPSWAALSSPISKNSPKQDIEGKWGDLSNAFKTIERQGTEISLVHGANGQMTIGKHNFEKGMTTYAKKWKRAEIYKRKSAEGLQAKKKKHDCGTPPPQGKYWSGINPPILSTNNKLTGATTNMLRK